MAPYSRRSGDARHLGVRAFQGRCPSLSQVGRFAAAMARRRLQGAMAPGTLRVVGTAIAAMDVQNDAAEVVAGRPFKRASVKPMPTVVVGLRRMADVWRNRWEMVRTGCVPYSAAVGGSGADVFAFQAAGFAVGGALAVVGFFQFAVGLGHGEISPSGSLTKCGVGRIQ